MPMTSRPFSMPARTTARTPAFIPGESPPLVRHPNSLHGSASFFLVSSFPSTVRARASCQPVTQRALPWPRCSRPRARHSARAATASASILAIQPPARASASSIRRRTSSDEPVAAGACLGRCRGTARQVARSGILRIARGCLAGAPGTLAPWAASSLAEGAREGGNARSRLCVHDRVSGQSRPRANAASSSGKARSREKNCTRL